MLNMTFRIAASEWAVAFALARGDGDGSSIYSVRAINTAVNGRAQVCAGLPW